MQAERRLLLLFLLAFFLSTSPLPFLSAFLSLLLFCSLYKKKQKQNNQSPLISIKYKHKKLSTGVNI